MEYIVNIWQDTASTGTGCYWRGTDRATYIEKCKEALKVHPPYRGNKKYIRQIVSKEREVFAISEFYKIGKNFKPVPLWTELPVFTAEIRGGIPK